LSPTNKTKLLTLGSAQTISRLIHGNMTHNDLFLVVTHSILGMDGSVYLSAPEWTGRQMFLIYDLSLYMYYVYLYFLDHSNEL
jgi:hypothetical protein